MKKIVLAMVVFFATLSFGDDLVVFDNEYNIVPLKKKLKRVIIGNKDMINVSLLKGAKGTSKYLKIFGKKTGTTSILLVYRDGTMKNYHVYVNKNLGYIQKMINMIEPSLKLNKVGDSSAVITGSFSDPHNKNRVYALLQNAGIDMSKLMDLTETSKVNKMVRTKLYLVEINNQKAKDLGGVTGLGLVSSTASLSVNPTAANGATFSGWLLDNMGQFSAEAGRSVTGTLNFLEKKGVGKILDDTVLITTEDKNATFRVGGEVYIPIGMTQNVAGLPPTIQLEEKKYGLKLILTTQFMEKDDYMHIEIDIVDSQFDTNKEHDVQLGENVFVPSFVSKNMTTNVVVKSGQVIALGGRLHTEDIESEEKIPLLGDIPIIGEFFKHTVSGVKNNDLLFFLVPEIVDANENVDDSHYYRDFKKSAQAMHVTIEDFEEKSTTDEAITDKDIQEEPLAVANDTQVQKDSQEEEVVIVDEEPQTVEIVEIEEPKQEVIQPVIKQPKVKKEEPKPEKEQPKKELIKPLPEPVVEVVQPKEQVKETVVEQQSKPAVKEKVKEQKKAPKTEVTQKDTPQKESVQKNIQDEGPSAELIESTPRKDMQAPKDEMQSAFDDTEEDEEEPVIPSQEELLKDLSPTAEVSIQNIYIRDNPSLTDSKRVTIWKKGHKFATDGVKKVDGVEWLKIIADCQDGATCIRFEKPLWISKKYTNEL